MICASRGFSIRKWRSVYSDMHERAYSICEEYSNQIIQLYSEVKKTTCIVVVVGERYAREVCRRLYRNNYLITQIKPTALNKKILVFDYIEDLQKRLPRREPFEE